MTDNKALIARLRNRTSGLMQQAADALEAAAARESNLTVNYETAQANWDLTLDRAEAAEARNARLEAVAVAAKALGHDRVDGMSEYWDDGKLRSALAALETK